MRTGVGAPPPRNGAVLRWIAGDGEHVERLEVTLPDGTALTYRFPGGDLGGTMPEERQRCPVDVTRDGAVYRTTADRLPIEVRLQLDRLAAAGRQWQAHHGAPDVRGAVAKRNPFKKMVDILCAMARELNEPGAPWYVPVAVVACDVLCFFIGWGC